MLLSGNGVKSSYISLGVQTLTHSTIQQWTGKALVANEADDVLASADDRSQNHYAMTIQDRGGGSGESGRGTGRARDKAGSPIGEARSQSWDPTRHAGTARPLGVPPPRTNDDARRARGRPRAHSRYNRQSRPGIVSPSPCQRWLAETGLIREARNRRPAAGSTPLRSEPLARARPHRRASRTHPGRSRDRHPSALGS